MTKFWISAVMMAACGVAMAKLPPPDDATKAKAAEAAARAAWQAKVDSYQLCKVQDKIAAKYRAPSAGTDGKVGTAAMPVAAKPAATPAAATPIGAAPAGPTPAGAAPLAPCMDPGVFAYNQPEQKPLETSGAHSPTGTAISPPSVRAESATMAPAKK